MGQSPSRFVIPTGTDLTTDPDVFPTFRGIGYVSNKKPMWSTTILTSRSGRERRLPDWSYPRWNIELSLNFVENQTSSSDLMRLFAFFNNHSGAYKEFLWMDPEFNTYTDDTFGIGDGVTASFSLLHKVSVGNHANYEPSMAFYGSPTVKVNGSVLNPINYTLGPYGNIIFNTAPASGAVLSSSGNFFYVCRFEDDEINVTQMMYRLWEGKSISMLSVKP